MLFGAVKGGDSDRLGGDAVRGWAGRLNDQRADRSVGESGVPTRQPNAEVGLARVNAENGVPTRRANGVPTQGRQ